MNKSVQVLVHHAKMDLLQGAAVYVCVYVCMSVQFLHTG